MAGSQSVVYVALGDSVTAGWLEHGILDSNAAYPALFRNRLVQLFPHAMVSVVNGGLGGDGVDGLLARLDRDALRYDPQLITVCVGLNDVRKGRDNVENFKTSLLELVGRIQNESRADVILITPNTRGDEWQTDGTTADYVRVIRAVAREKGVGLADVYAIYQGAIRAGANPADLLFQPRFAPDPRRPPDFRQRPDTVFSAVVQSNPVRWTLFLLPGILSVDVKEPAGYGKRPKTTDTSDKQR